MDNSTVKPSGNRCSLVEARYNSTWIDPKTRPNVTIALKVIYIFALLVVLISAVLMRWKWAKYERLRARGFVFFFATTMGMLIFLQSGPLQEILGKASIPCVWNLISSNMVVPLLGGALVGRLLDSMNKTNLARAIITIPLAQADFRDRRKSSCYGRCCTMSESPSRMRRSTSAAFEATAAASSVNENGGKKSVLDRIKRVLPRHMSSAESSTHDPPPPTHHASATMTTEARSSSNNAAAASISRPKDQVSDREFYFWRRLASRPGRIFLMSLILFPFIVASIGLILAEPYFYWQGCSGCAFSNAGLMVLVFTAAGIFIFAALASWRIRRFPDPFGIVRECRLSFLFGGLPAIIFFCLDKWEPRFRGHPDFSWIIPEILAVLFMFIVHGPLQLYLAMMEPADADISPRSSSIPHLDTGATVTYSSQQGSPSNVSASVVPSPELEDVLDDPKAKLDFEEFLISIWAAESLRFYVEAVAWGNDFHTMGPRTALSRAKRIVRVFVELSGSMTVNLKADVVNDLMCVLNPGFIIKDTFFHAAVEEILRLMRSDSFFRFRQTEAFARFAEEWRRGLDQLDPAKSRTASLRYSKRLSAECVIMNLNESALPRSSSTGNLPPPSSSPSQTGAAAMTAAQQTRPFSALYTVQHKHSSNEDGIEAVALV